MDAQQFLAEFGHIANAPGGVTRLRELILSLAFKGELCPHSEESMDVLLTSIERQRLEFNSETRKQRLTRHGSGAEKIVGPYEIPRHWSWISLSTVGHTWGQKKPTDSFVYIDVSSIDNKAGVLSQNPEVLSASAAPSRARKIVKKGTLVYSTVRPYLLNIAIIDRDFEFEPIASTAFAIVHPWDGISVRYLHFYLRSPIFVRYVETVQIGMAYPAISDEKFYSGLVPLPPAEEQSRIVAKVDELMALCDKLETQQKDRRKLQNKLRQSTLQAVAAASPHELQTTWTRLADNFGRLFHAPEDVNELRTVILELAVQGFLSDQLQSDGDATELIQSLSGSDIANVHSSRTKRLSQQREIAEAEYPFALPFNWAWVRLSEIGYFLGGGTPSKSNPDYWRGDIPWVSPKDMKVAYINSSQDTISRKAVEETAVKLIPPGALLVVVRGMILAHSFPVGMACQELTINQDMKALCPYLSEMSEFLLLLLSASKRRFLGMVERSTHGTCRLETDRFVSCVVGLPPLAEQQRIVERVTQLMRFCDALESNLRHANELSGRLAIASVSSLTGITTEQEDEPMKAPQTELIAPLHLGKVPDIKAQAPLATILARHQGEMPAKDLWQRFGGEIDAFYAQLKTEVAHGWIVEPAVAEMREKRVDTADA